VHHGRDFDLILILSNDQIRHYLSDTYLRNDHDGISYININIPSLPGRTNILLRILLQLLQVRNFAGENTTSANRNLCKTDGKQTFFKRTQTSMHIFIHPF